MLMRFAVGVVVAVHAAGLPLLARDDATSGRAPTTRVEDGETGVLWRGEPGIRETVAEIMAREARLPIGALLVRQTPRHGALREKSPNPEAPAVSRWPAGGTLGTHRQVPVPRNPQTVGTSFLAVSLSESGLVPADPMGDVSPTQILVHANGRIKLFDKQGNVGSLDATDLSFWNSVRDGANVAHPHVRYDRLSGRWFLTAINTTNPNRVMIAVSTSSTITNAASFTFFQFQHDLVGTTPNVDTGLFADYPTLGVDKNAVYVGVNVFNGQFFSNSTGFVVNKADLLASSLTATAFRALVGGSTGMFAPQGVHNDDPSAGEGYFIGADNFEFGKLIMRRVTNPGATPSISGDMAINVPSTAFPILQVHAGVAGDRRLDAVDDRLFAASVHTNKITGARSLWTAHNIEVDSTGAGSEGGGRNGSRWYEIGALTGSPTLQQSGTLWDPSGSDPFGFWNPSVATSGQGHMALGANRASADPTNGFARIAAAGRLRTDAAGATQAHTLAQSSSSPYLVEQVDGQRWGEYSQTVIDPTDDQTAWTFQQYCNSSNSWGVRAIQLKAPPPATPSSAGGVAGGQASVDVTVMGTSSGGSEFFDPGPDTGGLGFPNHIAGAVSGGVVVNSATFVSPTQVTLNVSTVGVTPGTKNVTITNPDGQQATGTNILSVSCQTITVNESQVATGKVGTGYSQTFTQTGGLGTTTFSLFNLLTQDSTPPSGLTFNTGLLSGTPNQAGSFPFIITATDQNNCKRDRAYTLVVTSAAGTGPTALAVDSASNGVLDPTDGSVIFAPTWFNNSGGSISPTGTLSAPSSGLSLGGDTAASYSSIADNASGSCTAGNCYTTMSAPGSRPGQHWDATATETLASPTDSKNWTIHVGGSFADVPTGNSFYAFVETIFHKGVTSGCNASSYCPTSPTTRDQMAVFLLRGKLGSAYVPPACTGIFQDVACPSSFANFVEDLANRKITSGCNVSPPLYCPGSAVTRGQMAVFLLKALEGAAYVPPTCSTPPFNDVPVNDPFCSFIKELAARAITSGCGGGNYCPNASITRDQMAVFLTRNFALLLYGP